MNDQVLEVVIRAKNMMGPAMASARASMNKFSSQSRKAFTNIRQFSRRATDAMRRHWMKFAAVALIAVLAIKKIGSALIKTASTVEDMKTRLTVLLKSVVKGNQVFKDMADLAGRVPKTYEEIMGAATELAGVVSGGTEEIKKLMPIIVDLSAGTGIAVRDVNSQMIKMYSAGASAADMFRDRGVLAALGFKAGVSYTNKQTMDTILKQFDNMSAKYAGAAKKLAKTWTGMTSMMKDAWFNFKKDIGEDFFSDLKMDMRAILFIIKESKDKTGEYAKVVKDLKKFFKDAYANLKDFGKAGIVTIGQLINLFTGLRLVLAYVNSGVLQLGITLSQTAGIFVPLLYSSKKFIDTIKTMKIALGETRGEFEKLEKAAIVDWEKKAEEGMARFEEVLERGINATEMEDKMDKLFEGVRNPFIRSQKELTEEQIKAEQERWDILKKAQKKIKSLREGDSAVQLDELDKQVEIWREKFGPEGEGLSIISNYYDLVKEEITGAKKAAMEAEQEKVDMLKDVSTKIQSLTMTETAFKLAELDKEVAGLRDKFGLDGEALKIIQQYYDLVKKEIIDSTAKTKEAWSGIADIVKGTASLMASSLSRGFFDVVTNDTKDLKEVFVDFSKDVLKMITDVIAKIMVMKALMFMAGGADGSILGVPLKMIMHEGGMVKKYHTGGKMRAANGMKLQSDEVPIIAQTGERVLSRGQNAAYERNNMGNGTPIGRGEQQPLIGPFVIKAWDAQDVYRNKDMLVSAVTQEFLKNGAIRGIIKQNL